MRYGMYSHVNTLVFTWQMNTLYIRQENYVNMNN